MLTEKEMDDPPEFIMDLFDALRTPEDDPDDGTFAIVPVLIDDTPEWVIAAIVYNPGTEEVASCIPVLRGLPIGSKIEMVTPNGKILATEITDFVRGVEDLFRKES